MSKEFLEPQQGDSPEVAEIRARAKHFADHPAGASAAIATKRLTGETTVDMLRDAISDRATLLEYITSAEDTNEEEQDDQECPVCGGEVDLYKPRGSFGSVIIVTGYSTNGSMLAAYRHPSDHSVGHLMQRMGPALEKVGFVELEVDKFGIEIAKQAQGGSFDDDGKHGGLTQ